MGMVDQWEAGAGRESGRGEGKKMVWPQFKKF